LNFTGPPSGVNHSAAPDIIAESSPFSIFILFFRQVFQIILTETNRYFHQYKSSRATGRTSSQPPDITVEMYTFFRLMIQMGNDPRYSLKDIGPERSNTVFHFIQMIVIAFSTFFDSFILKTLTTLRTMLTQTMTDCEKYERFLTH
jgi:hypothetical protein